MKTWACCRPQREGTGGRTRTYSARDRARLKLTLRAKRLGLSLTEAKEIIDLYESPRDSGRSCKNFCKSWPNTASNWKSACKTFNSPWTKCGPKKKKRNNCCASLAHGNLRN